MSASPVTDEDGEQEAAVDLVNAVAAMLIQRGYEFVAVSVAKLVPLADGKVSLPGATLFEAKLSIASGLPNLARGLRTLADQVDKAFRRSGAAEASESFTHVIETVKNDRRMISDADRKVLIAMDAIPDALLLSWIEASQVTRGLPELAIVELRRRRAQKEG